MSNEATYVPINTVDIVDAMIVESVNTETSYKKSIDKTESILKFNIKNPNLMAGKTKYDHAGITQYIVDNPAKYAVFA